MHTRPVPLGLCVLTWYTGFECYRVHRLIDLTLDLVNMTPRSLGMFHVLIYIYRRKDGVQLSRTGTPSIPSIKTKAGYWCWDMVSICKPWKFWVVHAFLYDMRMLKCDHFVYNLRCWSSSAREYVWTHPWRCTNTRHLTAYETQHMKNAKCSFRMNLHR